MDKPESLTTVFYIDLLYIDPDFAGGRKPGRSGMKSDGKFC